MTNTFWKTTKNLCENGYGVTPTVDGLADVFASYDNRHRAQILNDMDASAESFDGETARDTADNMALSIKLHAVHAALQKSGR